MSKRDKIFIAPGTSGNMNIGIIGDTHIGAGYNLGITDPDTQLNTRLLDFAKTFNYIIDEFVKRNVQKIIITGDIFDSRFPTPSQLKVFAQCFNRAIDFNIKELILLAGNHDRQRSINSTTLDHYKELKLNNLKIVNDFDTFKLDKYMAGIFLPYKDKKMFSTHSLIDAKQIFKTHLNRLINNYTDIKKIVVGHFMLEERGVTDIIEDLNEIIIPIDFFDKVDVTIMGHVHKFKIIQETPPIIHIGSMEKNSFGEKEYNNKSIILNTETLNLEMVNINTRNLYEIYINCTENKIPKEQLIVFIIDNIKKYNDKNNLSNSIIKLEITIDEKDVPFVDINSIKSLLCSLNIHNCVSLHLKCISDKQLRNKNIDKILNSKNAIKEYINNIIKEDGKKELLLTYAEQVISEVDGITCNQKN